MKRILTCIAFFSFTLLSLTAQDVVSHRISDLQNELYVIDGDAILEQLSDGSSRLRLSEDFDTPWGPDVRILLNNSVSSAGAFEVVNLTDINHFDGELRVTLPPGFDIEEYNFVVFFCVTFNQLWASGQFGGVIGNSGSICKESTTFGASGASEYDICPSDGTGDVLSFSNSINEPAGLEYVYIITDENEIVTDFTSQDFYNFEGSSSAVNRVYGMNFNGNMNVLVGQHRLASGSDGCFEHSSDSEFLTVTKNDCAADFVCEETLTATTDWVTNVEICPTDGQSDMLELRNNKLFEVGEHYVYLITDANDNLQEIVDQGFYDFEGSGESEQRVYGLHFDGTLNPAVGQNRLMTTASGCFEHSGSNLFLTIQKTACAASFVCESSLTATTDWATSVDICPTDGQDDLIELRNNLFIDPGIHYAYLITDAQGILLEVTTEMYHNFEGSEEAEQRVYGIHYDGTLNPQIGQDRRMTTATGCFEHSGDNLFLTVSKTGSCSTTSTVDAQLAKQIDVYPNPSSGFININYNDLSVEFDQVSIFDITGKKVKEIGNLNNVYIGEPGMYLIQFSNAEVTTTKKLLIQ